MSDHGQYRVPPLLLQIGLLLSLPTGGFISRRRRRHHRCWHCCCCLFFLSLPQRLSPHIVVAWQTGFVCGMCTSVCCCCRRRLVLLQQPLAVIRANQASPGLSGQMGTAFKFRKAAAAAAACPFPDATYTQTYTRPHL